MVVEGFWSGIHRSPYHGFSVEFTEYRQYTDGDDPRYLDWRCWPAATGTSSRNSRMRQTCAATCWWTSSRSMGYGSLAYTKAAYAATLAATLAYFLYLQGDAVGLIAFDDRVRDYLPPRHRTGHLRTLMHALDGPADGRNTRLAEPLERAAALIRKRSLVMLISDFLAPLDDLQPRLLSLSAAGHDVIVFQVLDPAERDFAFGESALFEDLESGRTVLVDPGAARTGYLRRLQAHNDALRRTLDHLGMAFRQVTTDQPLELVLFDFLRARMQQGRRTHQRGSP
jgi:uncharacterized protein (DUF58 family)